MSRRRNASVAHMVAVLALVNVLAAIVCTPVSAQSAEPLRIVAFGDSLSSGLGLKASEAFPAQLQRALEARGHDVVIVDAGVSGDTSAAGRGRLAWAVPDGTDGVILAFGGNDALRGIDPAETRANMEKMVAALKERRIPILLVGMRAPANWGEAYVEAFDAIFPDLARAHDLVFYPFFLEGVALDPAFNQPDGLHPSREGVAEIVKRILPSVEELIARVQAQRAGASKS